MTYPIQAAYDAIEFNPPGVRVLSTSRVPVQHLTIDSFVRDDAQAKDRAPVETMPYIGSAHYLG